MYSLMAVLFHIAVMAAKFFYLSLVIMLIGLALIGAAGVAMAVLNMLMEV